MDFRVFDGVYPPSEDTILLLECIKEFTPNAFEVCCGSGIVSLKLAQGGTKVLTSDIDVRACKNTLHNAKINNLYHMINVVRTDLSSAVRGKFDVIYCNPPYLPFSDNVPENTWWSGGLGGVEKITKLIKEAKSILKEGGALFLVFSSLSDVDSIYSTLRENGFSYEVLKSKKFESEEIFVIRALTAEKRPRKFSP